MPIQQCVYSAGVLNGPSCHCMRRPRKSKQFQIYSPCKTIYYNFSYISEIHRDIPLEIALKVPMAPPRRRLIIYITKLMKPEQLFSNSCWIICAIFGSFQCGISCVPRAIFYILSATAPLHAQVIVCFFHVQYKGMVLSRSTNYNSQPYQIFFVTIVLQDCFYAVRSAYATFYPINCTSNNAGVKRGSNWTKQSYIYIEEYHSWNN